MENWNRLVQIDKAADQLPEKFRIAALRTILTGDIETHINLKMSKPGPEPTLQEVVTEVRRYTSIARAQAMINNGTQMELDNVESPTSDKKESPPAWSGKGPPPVWETTTGGEWWGETWYPGTDQAWPGYSPTGYEDWGGRYETDISQLSKGKGKGKFSNPFYGTCSNCHRVGHRANYCPDLGKGYKGICDNCGVQGHSKGLCPGTGYKGGKGGTGGTM